MKVPYFVYPCLPSLGHYLLEGQTLVHSVGKGVGGDEFYLTGYSNENVVAVAEVNDLRNGSYSLSWCGQHASAMVDKVVLTPQYTCGYGTFAPPTKQYWPDGKRSHAKPVTLLEHDQIKLKTNPLVNKVRIPKGKTIVAHGDSLMEQFTARRPVKYSKVQAALTTRNVVTHFLAPIDKLVVKHSPDVLMLNSGVWDILESGPDQAYEEFSDHLQALVFLLTHIHNKYSDIKIVWKSMTAMHLHRCDCGVSQACKDRVKYMSTSRAKALYLAQKETIENLFPRVTFLDMYHHTYANAHQSRPNDGRHYTVHFNEYLWSVFGPK